MEQPTVYGPVVIREATRLVNTTSGNARYRLLLSNGDIAQTKPDSSCVAAIQNMLGDTMFGTGTSSSVPFHYTLNKRGQIDSVSRADAIH